MLIVKFAEDSQVGMAVTRTRIAWVELEANPLKVAEVCQVVPSLLYCSVLPTGDVTTIVPVVTAQVGCVIVATGLAGAEGIAFMIKFAVEIHVIWTVLRA